jgi:putative Holliday junction resolvase
MGRIIALDLGEKRVGVAISDPTLTIAQPFRTILFKNLKSLAEKLKEIVEKHEVEMIVIGFPLTLKGKYSKKTVEIQEIYEKLKSQIPTPIQLYDERLTTTLAHNTMHQLNRKPSKERDKIDQLAAMHLLQNYLDRKSRSEEKSNTE